ncbi:MAG TPA: hypothetical protein VFG59_13630 [Anaeromyxobacter sp.]|nr:hypothetical protein [Anaeromyxobacter sp.]
MKSTLWRALGLFGSRRPPQALDGFVDSLLQSFENCRDGLGDEAIRRGEAEEYFRERYLPERARLADVVRLENSHLDERSRAALLDRIDQLVLGVLIPGYARLSASHTSGERNDFYHAPSGLHALERVGFAALGALVGAFVVWAPFIPLWSKEWILPFFLAGLVYPELRRVVKVRRYERELNRLVSRTDAEIGRIDVSYLIHPGAEGRVQVDEGSETWSRSLGERRQRER